MSETHAWVLVVDDDPVNRAMLTRFLEQDGYRVDTAADGRQALERLQSEPFDVVLLDVLMPEMTGDEVLAQMQQDDALRHVPVIMITGLDDIESAVRCIETGAEDYLPKPFDPVVLRARMKAGLAKKRLHDLEAEHLAELARLNRRLEARIATRCPAAVIAVIATSAITSTREPIRSPAAASTIAATSASIVASIATNAR